MGRCASGLHNYNSDVVSIWEAGSQVGPYVLISEIGAGSMGDVWKARDSRLERIVAIKRLRVAGAAIEREARTIAGLNHPNICTLHDIGGDYLVMEFIDGAPLAGPMEPAEALRVALQIVGALEAAHGKGIVHRDLKPANILLSQGQAKLLDFGIAKARAGITPDATMTAETSVSGTPAYMAPEQAQGRATDARVPTSSALAQCSTRCCRDGAPSMAFEHRNPDRRPPRRSTAARRAPGTDRCGEAVSRKVAHTPLSNGDRTESRARTDRRRSRSGSVNRRAALREPQL